MKTCQTCKQNLSLSEFYPDKTRKGGFKHECKTCRKASVRVWQVDNPDKRKAARGRYRAKNIDKIRRDNRERMRRLQREDPERIRKPSREWRRRNKELAAKKFKEYMATDRGKFANRENQVRRRRAIGSAKVPAREIEQLFADHDHLCVYCAERKADTIDHFEPLAKGGAHAIENLVPACRPCNSSKHDLDPWKWADREGLDRDRIMETIMFSDPNY